MQREARAPCTSTVAIPNVYLGPGRYHRGHEIQPGALAPLAAALRLPIIEDASHGFEAYTGSC